MSNLRRLRALILPKGKEKINPGPPPQPLLLKTSQLRVNDDYQRSLSRDSTRMAIKIATEFDWELYHLPVVSPLDEVDDTTGLPLYELLDGQHTSIGALTNGHVKELWCWPGRKNETLESRATSFTKLNVQRTAVTPVENFWASVSAKDEEALEIIEACTRTGAAVVKRPTPYGDMKVGETICVGQLKRLAERGGRPYVERVLRIAMELRLAPIGQHWILALEELLFKENSLCQLKGPSVVVDLQIANAVGRLGQHELVQKAKITSAGASHKERRSVPWLMAFMIKGDIDKHAASK